MPMFWWMELNLVSVKGNAMPSGVFWSVCGLDMALDNLSVHEKHFVPVLLMVCCDVSSIGGCWPLCGAWSLC